jgi:hypothetical protein
VLSYSEACDFKHFRSLSMGNPGREWAPQEVQCGQRLFAPLRGGERSPRDGGTAYGECEGLYAITRTACGNESLHIEVVP